MVSEFLKNVLLFVQNNQSGEDEIVSIDALLNGCDADQLVSILV